MKVIIESSCFLNVELSEHHENCGDNGDRFSFCLTAEGQKIEVNGVEVDEVAFDIIGGCELNDLLDAMAVIKKLKR